VLTAHRLERLTVTSKLLVAADGPSSVLRQQALGDGAPAFEVRGSAEWTGIGIIGCSGRKLLLEEGPAQCCGSRHWGTGHLPLR
jgi:2-polyprenyl-6-methoxyphenol hydroxylase-like FAD-dependent oxidoreductase